jgi:hypothetical protein
MKPVWWMVGAGGLSWLVAAAVPGVDSDVEILLGMIAPLTGAVATWVLVVRTYPTNPERLTPLMVAAFGAKVVFFGTYVTVMLGVLSLRPLPFVISFTAYFIALLVFEALCLQRLFARNLPAARWTAIDNR